MQHVERPPPVLVSQHAEGGPPDAQRGWPATNRTAQSDHFDAIHSITRGPIRVAHSDGANVVGAGQRARQVPQGGDAPVSLVGAETWDDQANSHGDVTRYSV